MSFDKAAQNMPEDAKSALAQFKIARAMYGKECSNLTKLRLLGDHPNADNESIVRYAKARKRHKLVCKEFNMARENFISTLRGVNEPKLKLSDDEYLALYGAGINEIVKQEERAQELAQNVPDQMIEDARKVMSLSSEARERFIDSGKTIDEFIASEAIVKPENPDVDSSGNITFDPEFDKL